MQTTPETLANRLKAEGNAVMDFFQKLPEELWRQELYSSGGVWRLRELLAHFIAAEQGFIALIQNVAGGGSGVEADFDIDAYNERTVESLRAVEPDVLLGQYAMVRERTAAVVSELRAEQLTIRGRHPYLGETDLEAMIKLIYNHNTLHLRDARRALAEREEQP